MSLNLNTLKENIQAIFEAANTTTASVDLSSGLATRVQAIYKVNPARIPIQSSLHPFVTCWVDNKSIELLSMGVNQTNTKRETEIELKVAGAVWNNTYVNVDVDEADDDCESLMENVEEILRANPTLAGFALWSYPTNVSYHSSNIDEGVNLRAGVLTLKVKVHY